MDRSGRAAALAVALVAAGCVAEDTELPTSQLQADLILHSADGERTTAVARFYDPDGLLYRLGGLDKVTASIPGWVVSLDASLATDPVYTAEVPTVAVDGRNLIIVQREYQNNAAGSEVAMPPELDMIPASDSFSRSEGLSFSFDPVDNGDRVLLIVEGPCVEETEIEVDASSGTYTLPGGTLEGSGDCGLEMVVRRYRFGDVDGGFREGTIEGRHERTLLLESTE